MRERSEKHTQGENEGKATQRLKSKSNGHAAVRQRPCVSARRRSSFLAQKELLKRSNSFRRSHPLAEEMVFLTDAADQILWRQLQQFSGDCDRIGRQRANLACHLP